MPIIQSAIKRMKQTVIRRERNVSIKRDVKEATKAFLAQPTSKTLSAAHSELDTAVKKKLLKKNTVARRKARLSKIAKDAGVKLAPTKSKTSPKPVVAKKTEAKATPKKTAAPKKTIAKKTTKKAS